MNIFPEFKCFQKIPRFSREIVITEKIDGTNGIIYIDEENNIFAGSRKRWLWGSIQEEIPNDNYGFAKWIKENQDELRKLGPGFHYGEWMGQGIQRGYGLKEKRFYLFNTRKWVDSHNYIYDELKDKKKSLAPNCCYVVPVLFRGKFDTIFIEGILQNLTLKGSSVVPGYMNPEGIVIYHTASGQLFKKTIENDEKPKRKR